MLKMLGRLLGIWTLVFGASLLITAAVFSLKDLSLTWLLQWYFLAATVLLAYRVAIYQSLRILRRRYRINLKRVALIGYGATGCQLHRIAEEKDCYGYEVKAIYCDDPDVRQTLAPEVAKISSLADMPACIEAYRIDEVWVTFPLTRTDSFKYLHNLLNKTVVSVRIIPEIGGFNMAGRHADVFMGFAAIDVNSLGGSDVEILGKAILDRAIALLALAILMPLLMTIALAIKLTSPGPVIFKQLRHGLNGKRFYIYKFRSMQVSPPGASVVQARKNDQRVTPLGGFLRRTSIDELPQLINVLCGDMSIVGPRPHAVEHNEYYGELVNLYMQRHRVKPGITGWAQIHGLRGETDTLDKMANRVRLDLEYIQNWSLWMDMQIIAWTAVKGWTGKNAY
jgi:putative colanic acid biosynthesis UDP-glucose lipid carrier transferase